MLTKQLRELERQAEVLEENVKVVRTSELLKMLTIPALGQYTSGKKFFDGVTKFFVKKHGKYKLQPADFNFTMVIEYETNDWVVQLSESDDYKNIYLAGIYVFNKGKGIGTEVINKILDHCDEYGYKLYLHPFPIDYKKGYMSDKNALLEFYRLKDWYKSFDMVEEENGYMVYHPQK